MLRGRESFCKNICQLLSNRCIGEFKETFEHFLSSKVTIKLNVLGPLMKNKIFTNMNGTLIVTIQGHMLEISDLKISEQSNKPSNLEVVAAIALYSASLEDLEIVPCFLDFQETGELPSNKT